MTSRSGDTIWELLRQAAETLPEPFSRPALINWVQRQRPDVEESSISTHIQFATANAINASNPFRNRTPLLQRVHRGLYRRYRSAPTGNVSAGTSEPPVPAGNPPSTGSRVLLIGCSRTKADAPAPASELFLGQGFRKGRDYAIREKAPWFVLSAKFGLLEPDTVVSPYDVYLGGQPMAYRRAWGQWVAAQLAVRMSLGGVTVEVHAGEAYTEPLREPLGRLGAVVVAPLAHLGQGERLAWPGYRPTTTPNPREPAPDLDWLLDSKNAVSPAEFVAAGSAGRDVPGLYTWWVDEDGARALSAGLGQHVQPGLLYAGKAGGDREKSAPSTNTVWGRVGGNHLRGNVGSSTFRRSLAAILGAAGRATSEQELTAWMFAHLRVATLAVPSEQVAALEADLVARANPPLNLAGVPRNAGRSTLTRLRSLVSREPKAMPTASGQTAPASSPGPLALFERRIRADVDAMVRSGYRPTIFQRMLSEHGALETVRRLLAAPQLSDGFRYLWEHQMLQHSVENAVLAPEFYGLFSETEREIARTRLREAGFRG